MSQIDIFATDNTPLLSANAIKRIKELERVIEYLDTLYEAGEDCIHPDTKEIVADIEYDAMRNELYKLDPNSKVFTGVTASNFSSQQSKKVIHNPPMTSISKANGKQEEKEDILNKWISNLSTDLGLDENETEKWIVQAYKRDGVACALYYEKGQLKKAGLRPRDGINGEDISINIQFVKGVPQKLPLPITCSIRGELECQISTFLRLNGTSAVENQEFANPRNYTAGSIRQYKDPIKTKSRELNFTAYSIEGLDNYKDYYKTERERAIWCNKVLKIPFVRVEFFKKSDLQILEDKVSTLDYEVDGIVLSVNDLELQEQAGRQGNTSTGNPKGKIAWKFADDIAEPSIKEIIWEVGRTGKITPVFTFDPVQLAGTMVSKAAGYSFGFVLRNKVNVGTKCKIRKSGKIIPETLGFYIDGEFIDKQDMEGDSDSLPKQFDYNDISYPKQCPSCKKDASIQEGQKHGLFELICDNDDCPAKNTKRFVNYIQKFGCKGLADSTVDKLVEDGLISTFADFYTLNIKDVHKALGSSRISLLTIARIHMIADPEKQQDNKMLAQATAHAMSHKKEIQLAKFISCLGIPGVSKGTGRALAQKFRDFNRICDASLEELESTEDVGSKTAKNIRDYFDKYYSELKDLVDNHIEILLPKTGKFNNKTFVFTGGLPEGKDYWKEKVEDEGGKVSSSVSKKTHYVVIGTDPGQKADKARELAVDYPLIILDGEEDLQKLLEGKL